MGLIKFSNPDLKDLPRTALTANVLVGGTTLTVEQTQGFNASDWLLLENYGTAKSELAQVSAAAPTATAFTLLAGQLPDYSHGIGASIKQILFNQIAIEYSTNLETLWNSGAYATIDAATSASTWVALATININPTDEVTGYNDPINTNRSYRSRYYNSFTGVYSTYGDAILPSGYEEYSVGYIINNALGRTNKTISYDDAGQITSSFLITEINNCLRYVDSKRRQWSHNMDYSTVMSELTAGKQDYNLPTNIDVRNTNMSMFNVRVNGGENLTYIGKRTWDDYMKNIMHSTLIAQLTTVSTTAVFTDTSNFADSGEFTVITGTTQDTVSYTANNRTTNTLTLSATTGVTTTHAITTDVWQGASFGTPTSYTIFEGKLYFDNVPDISLYQRTIEIDFYKKLILVNSENDYIQIRNPLLVFDWLCMAIFGRLGDNTNEGKHKNYFETQLKDMLSLEKDGQPKFLSLNYNVYRYNKRSLNNHYSYDSD